MWRLTPLVTVQIPITLQTMHEMEQVFRIDQEDHDE